MEEKSTPTLSNEQKLAVLVAHRAYIQADSAAQLAEQRKQVALDFLTRIVDKVGIELGVEKGKYTINLDTLSLDTVKG